jgi:dienelactone hydrolase
VPQTSSEEVLADFSRAPFTALGHTRNVYRRGEGPCVLVLTEMPGITPAVAEFARKVSARGLSVAMPHLFGADGAEPSNLGFARALAEVCVSRQFAMFATQRSSPITDWLTVLARREQERCGGPGVGVVGMCLTGGFALAMLEDPVVVAPVLSQPSLPGSFRRRSPRRASLGLSPAQKDALVARATAGQCVLGLRFTGDQLAPPERFVTLRQLLGDRFIGVEIDSSPGNPWGYAERAHSVLTEDLGDNADSPSVKALAQVLDFLDNGLRAPQP